MPHDAIELRGKHLLDDLLEVGSEAAEKGQDVLSRFANVDGGEPICEVVGDSCSGGKNPSQWSSPR